MPAKLLLNSRLSSPGGLRRLSSYNSSVSLRHVPGHIATERTEGGQTFHQIVELSYKSSVIGVCAVNELLVCSVRQIRSHQLHYIAFIYSSLSRNC